LTLHGLRLHGPSPPRSLSRASPRVFNRRGAAPSERAGG
jgi:hypothetical protein